MENIYCPICNEQLKTEHKIKYIDYTCVSDDSHFYAHRIKDDVLTKVKVRFVEPDGGKLYFKINYDLGTSQVWTKSNDDHRTTIDTVFSPDFSDTEKLKNKIRTYLVFS